MLRAIPVIVLMSSLAACAAEEPVDAAGEYTIALTSRENGCEIENWAEGSTSMGIPITITQEEDQADATVGGLAGGYLDLVLGGRTYSGDVSGNNLDLTLFGTRETQTGGCAFFINSIFEANLDGDVLVGRIIYTFNGNGSPDCQMLEGCESVQDFNGTRPPS